MNENELRQDTGEWHAWRNQGIGSSEASSLMRVNPYKTLRDLWIEKTTGEREKFSEKAKNRMDNGKHKEKYARDLYCWDNLVNMEPTTFVHPNYSFIRASSDGFDRDKNYGIEIKTPQKLPKDLTKVPKLYYPQLQWLMLVSQTNLIDYITYDGNVKIHVVRIHSDLQYQSRMIRYAKWFWHKVKNNIDPGKREFRHIKIYDQQVY